MDVLLVELNLVLVVFTILRSQLNYTAMNFRTFYAFVRNFWLQFSTRNRPVAYFASVNVFV